MLPDPCLALVTDRTVCPPRELAARVSAAVAGGVGLVQLREKDLPAGELLSLALDLRRVTIGRALFLVNDRVDVAVACDADGVQLGEDGLPVGAAREILGASGLIGRSVHSVEGALEAEAAGADFVVVGTVFPSATHPGGSYEGVDLIEAVCRRVGVPVLAIGGVTSDNVGAVMSAGAHGAAVIRAVLGSDDPEGSARSLDRAMRAAPRPARKAARGA